jgi:hypothetical protein
MRKLVRTEEHVFKRDSTASALEQMPDAEPPARNLLTSGADGLAFLLEVARLPLVHIHYR